MIFLPVRISLLMIVSILGRLECGGNGGFRDMPQSFPDVPRSLAQSIRRQPFGLSLPDSFIVAFASSFLRRPDRARGGAIGLALHGIFGLAHQAVFNARARNRAGYKPADKQADARHQQRILFHGFGESLSRTLAEV